jgi:hypothetical protein
MIRILLGVFVVLHGLVHLLYVGQSARFFELQPGLAWPDGSWLFSRFLGVEANRTLGSIMLVLVGVGFAASGIGMIAQWPWWRQMIVGSALFSTAIFILFYDGAAQHLDAKGAVAILINVAILAVVLIFRRASS